MYTFEVVVKNCFIIHIYKRNYKAVVELFVNDEVVTYYVDDNYVVSLNDFHSVFLMDYQSAIDYAINAAISLGEKYGHC